MAEYIDKKRVVDELIRIAAQVPDSKTRIVAKCINAVELLPAADVVRVQHGRWTGEGDGYADGAIVYDVWYCSKCDYCIDDGTDDPDLLPKFCPECGAKMDGGQDAENHN